MAVTAPIGIEQYKGNRPVIHALSKFVQQVFREDINRREDFARSRVSVSPSGFTSPLRFTSSLISSLRFSKPFCFSRSPRCHSTLVFFINIEIGNRMGASSFQTLLLLLVVGYFILYFGGRKYLECFSNKRFNGDGSPVEIQNETVIAPDMTDQPDIPYLTNLNSPINSLNEYEVATVFNNRGSKPASRQQISDAMTSYPMDWTVQGPDSQHFQENQAAFEKEQANKASDPAPTSFYREVDGSNMTIPDTEAMNEEEKQILQTYVPETSKGLLQYSVEDVKQLVDRVYTKRGLVPVINKSKQGENIWEITEVKEKDPKIVWEDEVERDVQRAAMEQRGEEVIQVPYTVTDVSAGLDPFFQSRNRVRDGKYDYTEWTPGLERMFAPTYPLKSWF